MLAALRACHGMAKIRQCRESESLRVAEAEAREELSSEKGEKSHCEGIIFICFLIRPKKALMSRIKSARPARL